MPVALNMHTIKADKGPAGDFYRDLQKQSPRFQGFWVVSLEGKVLSAHSDYKSLQSWPADALADLEKGLEAFGPIPPREVRGGDPWPDRGAGVRPDGSVRLAVSVRFTFGGNPRGRGTRDSIILSAKDWDRLRPPEVSAGEKWPIPDRVARQFCRCLSPDQDPVTMASPDEVTDCGLVGEVHAVADGMATVLYTGHVEATHKNPHDTKVTNHGKARLRGVGLYDVKKGRLIALALVTEGTFTPYPYEGRKTTFATAAAVDWKREPKSRK